MAQIGECMAPGYVDIAHNPAQVYPSSISVSEPDTTRMPWVASSEIGLVAGLGSGIGEETRDL
jgi:hypothetical protein